MTVSFEYDFEKATSALVYLASKPDAVPALDTEPGMTRFVITMAQAVQLI